MSLRTPSGSSVLSYKMPVSSPTKSLSLTKSLYKSVMSSEVSSPSYLSAMIEIKNPQRRRNVGEFYKPLKCGLALRYQFPPTESILKCAYWQFKYILSCQFSKFFIIQLLKVRLPFHQYLIRFQNLYFLTGVNVGNKILFPVQPIHLRYNSPLH